MFWIGFKIRSCVRNESGVAVKTHTKRGKGFETTRLFITTGYTIQCLIGSNQWFEWAMAHEGRERIWNNKLSHNWIHHSVFDLFQPVIWVSNDASWLVCHKFRNLIKKVRKETMENVARDMNASVGGAATGGRDQSGIRGTHNASVSASPLSWRSLVAQFSSARRLVYPLRGTISTRSL